MKHFMGICFLLAGFRVGNMAAMQPVQDDELKGQFVGTPRTRVTKVFEYAVDWQREKSFTMPTPDWTSYLQDLTPLTQEQKDYFLLRAASAGSAESVGRLLQCEADVCRTLRSGCTALHLAVYSNAIEVVDVLLRHGCAINAQDYTKKETALHIATRLGYVDMVECLLACGADTTIKDRYDYAPIDFVNNWWRESRYWGETKNKEILKEILEKHDSGS